jgi:hypothetical protein
MIVRGYLILEPGADRPYFWHHYPKDYKKKPGSRVYSFDLVVPEYNLVDERIVESIARGQSES